MGHAGNQNVRKKQKQVAETERVDVEMKTTF